ncbi:MAG: MerR family transcriptional regulator [Vulcanimicrobiaceae bacterium]
METMERNRDAVMKTGEFATLAGVSVRTLHHYDELGLLKPSAHSDAGYRLYKHDDLTRLIQITALRFIGMPLKEIRTVLGGEPLSLAATLAVQRRIMLQKREQLDAAIEAIERAEAVVAKHPDSNWNALKEVIKKMEEQQDWSWAKKHYTPQQLERLAQRYDPAMQEAWSSQWSTLIAEVEDAGEGDPASAHAQTLAKRWSDLIAQFTNNEPDIEQSLKNVYANTTSAPKGFKSPLSDRAGAFISKAIKILKNNP